MKIVIIIIQICFKSITLKRNVTSIFFVEFLIYMYIYIFFFYLKRFERDIVEKGKQ